jgi:AraC family transcriptional regulator
MAAPMPVSRHKLLHKEEGFSLSLVWYPPRLRQPLHSHPDCSVSLLLWGSVEEQAAGTVDAVGGRSLSVKPDGLRHANAFGRDGAMLLSMKLHDTALVPRSGGGSTWRPASASLCAGAAAALSEGAGFQDLACDLLAALREKPASMKRPPLWLAQAREALHNSPETSLAALARQASVHRVHLSRAFSACFGETISQFRRRRRLELAVRARLHDGASGTGAAHEAGFADHSHLARTLRRSAGLSLTELTRLLS